MAEVSTLLATAVMVVVPAAMALRAAVRGVRQARAEQAVERRASARAAKRRPARGTTVVEGCIELDSEELLVVERREHGCLGGPLVYEVPTFRLRLADACIVTIEPGPDPTVNEAWRLPSPELPEPQPQIPILAPTGAGTAYALRGRLRVTGVLATSDTRFAPPSGHSVIIDVM